VKVDGCEFETAANTKGSRKPTSTCEKPNRDLQREKAVESILLKSPNTNIKGGAPEAMIDPDENQRRKRGGHAVEREFQVVKPDPWAISLDVVLLNTSL